ncbi:dihydrofolate reductase [Mucilaginibacter achroorhodeus]|uniref:Dihydrofolate reductase n=1 Tax=Mucilaginibacter achroorhodeus TaxID=2599294 RepID=A0A563TXW0_9SPHI|nr:dihydrofolate reductase family protein [Mucilaginibacter achroorhodeus]TWR23960.1 dihydrofolate reductase [Mucilaginibacter achroorhodeus]
MKKVKLQMQLSVDGFVAGPNGEMDWLTWNWDDELKNYVGELTASIDTIIMGRKLAEGFIPVWKERLADPQMAEFARTMVETPKHVFTKTLDDSPWEFTELATGDFAEEVNKIKSGEGKDIIVYGGAGFVSSLIKHNLIDEYHLFINPEAIGKGMAIFSSIEDRLSLTLEEARQFDCGVTVLRYRSTQK